MSDRKDIREYPEYTISNLFHATFFLFLAIGFVGIIATFRDIHIDYFRWYVAIGLLGAILTFLLYKKWNTYLLMKSRRALR